MECRSRHTSMVPLTDINLNYIFLLSYLLTYTSFSHFYNQSAATTRHYLTNRFTLIIVQNFAATRVVRFARKCDVMLATDTN